MIRLDERQRLVRRVLLTGEYPVAGHPLADDVRRSMPRVRETLTLLTDVVVDEAGHGTLRDVSNRTGLPAATVDRSRFRGPPALVPRSLVPLLVVVTWGLASYEANTGERLRGGMGWQVAALYGWLLDRQPDVCLMLATFSRHGRPLLGRMGVDPGWLAAMRAELVMLDTLDAALAAKL